MASTDLGDLGPHESEPAVVEWHWYYHLLGFAGWALIGALFVLIEENRNRSAWLILIPFLLLSEIVWPWTVRLLSLSSGTASQFEAPYQSLMVAWTAVWLLSPWLARRQPVAGFLLTLAAMAIIAMAAEVGVTYPLPDPRFYVRLYGYRFVRDATYLFPLPLAFALSAVCCRKKCRPLRFMIWLGPWLAVATFAGWVFQLMYLNVSSPAPIKPSLTAIQLSRILVPSICTAAVLYLLNLPFMCLALRCPAYGDRFHQVLRLPKFDKVCHPV